MTGSVNGDSATERGWARGITRFLQEEAAGAVFLVVATIVAFVLANSDAHKMVESFWEIQAGFTLGPVEFEQSLRHWVDDGLMAIFFFVVGLEIKREVVAGELSSTRSAALPVVAAIGGMLVPAAVYLSLNPTGVARQGWGIPMATDIAFAVGALALLGTRAPQALKIFMLALAIADDIGAILVIALFYTRGVSWVWLVAAAAVFGVMLAMNRMRVVEPLAYLAGGTVLWFCVLNSGVHATIAGVLAALAVPTFAQLTPTAFTEECRVSLDAIDELERPEQHLLSDHRQQRIALDLARRAQLTAAPLQRLELALHPFTTFVVLPLFALANAGVRVVGGSAPTLTNVGIGVALGLILGKPLGVMAASAIAVKSGLGELPVRVTWRHMFGASLLAGIGFTMSLFVANLAFGAGSFDEEVKIAVIGASLVAGGLGYAWLRWGCGRPCAPEEES